MKLFKKESKIEKRKKKQIKTKKQIKITNNGKKKGNKNTF